MVAVGVGGPKTSLKSKSWAAPATAEEEERVEEDGIVSLLSLAARREW